MPEAVAEDFKARIAAGNVFFVTRENEKSERAEGLLSHFGADQTQCEGCSRGDKAVLDDPEKGGDGWHWHAAPLIEVAPGAMPVRGRPYRCLREVQRKVADA